MARSSSGFDSVVAIFTATTVPVRVSIPL
jgi:hypothetical protein